MPLWRVMAMRCLDWQALEGPCVALEAGKVEFRQCSNVRGVWEMTVKQGNMCLALGGPGVVAMDCQEAAAVGAGSFFPVAVPKYDPQAAAGVHSTRQACPSKRCKAEQALGHVKFAHAEACHLQDQSKFGKRQASDFRSGILFQSCCGWHSGT